MSATPPTIEGPYTPLRLLGKGGMGAVWEVEHETTGQHFALKTVLGFEAEDLARFQREARTLAGLNHPHVVRLHAAELQGQQPYLVQELLSGGSLADALRKGPLEVERAREVARRLAAGVGAAHEAGVLHRDLKPDNVLFSEDGVPKVTDFGLAVGSNESRERLTLTGAVLGTPAYMAPEQALDARRVDERADVYGLGALLYAMLTGVPPLPTEGLSLIATLTALQIAEPRPPEELNPAVSPDLTEVCRVALAKDPADRYPSAAAFAEALGLRSAAPPGRAPWAPGVVAVGCAVLAVSGVAWVASRPAPTDSAPPVAAPPEEPPVEAQALVPPQRFKLGERVGGGHPALGAFVDDVLVTASSEALEVWGGRANAPLRVISVPHAEEGSASLEGFLALGPERALFGGRRIELSVWTPAGVRSLGLRGLRSLARCGDRAVYGLAKGKLGILHLEPSPVVLGETSLDLSPDNTREVQSLAWLSPTRIVAVTRGQGGGGDLTQEFNREGVCSLHLLSYDPESAEFVALDDHALTGAHSLAISSSTPQTIVVGSSMGHLFLWQVEHQAGKERLVAVGDDYRGFGAPASCRDLVFVNDTLCLGALAVRPQQRGAEPVKEWKHLNGVLVYDLTKRRARVFEIPDFGPRRLAYDAVGEQLVVLGDTGTAYVFPLATILEQAVELPGH